MIEGNQKRILLLSHRCYWVKSDHDYTKIVEFTMIVNSTINLQNRRATATLSPVLIHFVAPHGKLYQRLLALEQMLGNIPPIINAQRYTRSARRRKTG